MPRIEDNIVDCTVYLYESVNDADAGERYGGTGFLMAVPYKEDIDGVRRSHVYAVTNHHVIENGFPVIRLNKYDAVQDKWHDSIPLTDQDWKFTCPGPDLAVALLDDQEIVHNYRHYMWMPGSILIPKWIEHWNIGIGSDVFVVGRFMGHAGEQRNLPVVRFGNISMMNYESVDNPEWSCGPQEIYLVETRSISGMSGSPVFWYQLNPENPDEIDDLGVRLLGVDMGHMNVRLSDDPKKWAGESNSGMTMVIPAWHIIELLNRNDLRVQREQIEKQAHEEDSR